MEEIALMSELLYILQRSHMRAGVLLKNKVK
jgi:hypothetical protein